MKSLPMLGTKPTTVPTRSGPRTHSNLHHCLKMRFLNSSGSGSGQMLQLPLPQCVTQQTALASLHVTAVGHPWSVHSGLGTTGPSLAARTMLGLYCLSSSLVRYCSAASLKDCHSCGCCSAVP